MGNEGLELEKSIKAARSFKELLDNGPLMSILSIQFILIIVLGYLLIVQMNEKSEVQAKLYEQMIKRTDEMVDLKVSEKVSPVVEDARIAVDKLDSTRKTIDTASRELQNIIKRKK